MAKKKLDGVFGGMLSSNKENKIATSKTTSEDKKQEVVTTSESSGDEWATIRIAKTDRKRLKRYALDNDVKLWQAVRELLGQAGY